MEKNNEIKYKFCRFKNSLIKNEKIGFWIYIGSFFREDRKYITDIDIEFRLKKIRVNEYLNEIIDIYKRLKNYNIVKFMDGLKIYDDLKKKTTWNYNELVEGYKIIDNKKTYLKDVNILKVNFNLILKLNYVYIECDLIISHNKERLKRSIYNIHSRDKYYNRGDYYKYVKSVKVTYNVLVRDKFNLYTKEDINKMKKIIDEVTIFIQNKEFTISKYHLNKTLLKLKNMSSEKMDVAFNKLFIELADKLYNNKIIQK